MVMCSFKTQANYMRLPFNHGDKISVSEYIIFSYSLISTPELRN